MSVKPHPITQKVSCGVAVSSALLCLQHSAEASIIHTDPADTSITTGGMITIDLDGDSLADFTFSMTPMGGSFSYETRVLGMTGNQTFVSSVNYAKRFFSAGPPIEAGAAPLLSNPRTGANYGFGNFNFEVGFMGVQMQKPDGDHFGWIRITTSYTGLGPTFTIFDYAYNTVPNQPIEAGQTVGIPEPASSMQALAALAGFGVAAVRRRRKTVA